MNQKYLFLSIAAILAIGAMSLGSFVFAQTATPLACNMSASSVMTNQSATLTATGGTGSYVWSGQNLNVTNPTGSQFSVSYPNPGTYSVVVTSGNQTATCGVTVTTATSTGNLMCLPTSQNVVLGRTATFSATGGNGAYVWSSPDLVITNPNGTNFTANFASLGSKTITVRSGELSSTCAVNVLSAAGTPGLPNTGGGYNQ
ncbi:MAG: PKD domain-containing protein [Patescibacteria group bacterium]